MKAVALVTDHLNANKPNTLEPKPGKLTPAQLNNNKDLEVDMKKEEPSFFGSFFSSSKSQQQKAKGPQKMEAASFFYCLNCSIVTCLRFTHPVSVVVCCMFVGYSHRQYSASHPSTSPVERP